ncbi:MAG TPA: BMC domain-containing protein [Pirellulaceae bacterium]|nr:BMC domain-containing protein [Pirellulaceae bacterium]
MVQVPAALGLLETTGFTPAMVALDAMEKAARIEIIQAELNDALGVVLKIAGDVANVSRAIETGREWAERMGGKPSAQVISRPTPDIWPVVDGPREVNPLIQQEVVHRPADRAKGDRSVSDSAEGSALGFIETQGFTAVFQAIDTACKAANVEVLGKEKLGGGYVTIVIRGDVAAVAAAVESGKRQVEGLGKLIAAHVIPRPSASVLALLPPAIGK